MSKILYADDNKNIREYCRRELEDEGYDVLLARDGAEAIRLFGREPLDLVILDICMPGMDGLETVSRLREFDPDIPIVLFTSFDDICSRDKRSQCATACVSKHEDLRELKHVVAAALASRRRKEPYRRGLPPAALCGVEPADENAPVAGRFQAEC
jgi:CheY-like chemotaxis protein